MPTFSIRTTLGLVIGVLGIMLVAISAISLNEAIQRYSAAHFTQGTDFAALARAFGLRGERVRAEDLDRDQLRQLLDSPGPALIDVLVPGDENVLPMVPPGAANLDMILAPEVG